MLKFGGVPQPRRIAAGDLPVRVLARDEQRLSAACHAMASSFNYEAPRSQIGDHNATVGVRGTDRARDRDSEPIG